MATYNVGNIEIGASANTNNAISNLNNIIIKLTQINNVQNSFNKTTNRVNVNLKNTSKSVDSLTPKLKKAFNVGTLYLMINYLKRFSSNVIKLIGYASDYTEILNKFQVSFSQLYKENLEYVNKLSSAYGFSRATLMDYQSTFNNMLKSLKGLTDESSALISRTITQMAIDYSSLFNVSISRSMRAFQSVLSGSIRPIREVSGFDVSETSIFQVYKELGGTKTMRQLNQLEKRLLRIIAIQQQMAKVGAYGDYARTIETLANQIRIFQEQLKEFGSTYGQIILKQIKPFLQYANGVLIALNQIGKYLITIVDISSDIKMDEEFASIETNVLEADEAVQELNESLSQLGLDQLNVLGGTGSVTSAIGVDENILNAVGEYVSELDKVNFKAKEIANNILNWFGFTYNSNGELEKTGSRVDSIINLLKTGITAILSYGISAKIITIATNLSKIKKSTFAVGGKIAIIATVIATIVAGFVDMYNSNEEFRKSIDNTLDNIKKNLDIIWGILKGLYNALKPAIDWLIDVVNIIGGMFINSILKSIEMITAFLIGDFSGAWDSIKNLIIDIGDYCAQIFGFENWNNMIDKLKQVWESFKTFMWEKIFKPIANFGIQMVNGVIKGTESAINFLINFINDFTQALSKVWTWAGIPGIPEIGKVSWKTIPYLAKGNVATEPTLAMFGEYANATSNPEITAPQSILKDTFVESMVPFANAIIKGNQELAKSIKDQKVILNINGKELAEATISDYENVALRKGKELYSK